MSFVTDTRAAFAREMLPTLRNPAAIGIGLVQPLLYLILFAPMLGNVGPAGSSPLQWFVPGMMVMLCLFTTTFAGSSLIEELFSGAFERFLATPMSRPAILAGRALKELTPLLVQALLIIVVSLPFGLALHPVGMLAGLAILMVFGTGVSALSYSLAMASKRNAYMFWGVAQTVALPLMLSAGVLLPMEMAPGWLHAISRFNPLTYVVEAERALFSGHLGDPAVLYGAIVAVLVAIFGLIVGSRMIRRVTL